MATFFDHQERAQARTGWLVILFIAGTLGITLGVGLATAIVMPDKIPLALAIGALVVIVPFLFKLATVGSDGRQVAMALGGVQVSAQTGDPAERMVLNVVEEMAIASGMPIPPVFVLDEGAINAFAAGTSPQNAVIGVSRGAIEQLTRDELQGVMAHEFSHIFHGDMKINMRAIAAIFGLMAIGYVGYYLMRSGRFSRGRKGGGLLILGLLFMVLGAIGTLFARLMQAAISRQREFLADASAVQYTRNPAGIGGALMKIRRQSDVRMDHPEASQFNHMFFSEGVRAAFASHPPLEERIDRVKGMAGGVLPEPPSVPGRPRVDPSSIGSISASQLSRVHEAMSSLAPAALNAAHDPSLAWAPVFAVSLSSDQGRAAAQLRLIADRNPTIAAAVEAVLRGRLPSSVHGSLSLVDIACATLAHQPTTDYARMRALLADVLKADARIDLFEWVVTEILRARVEMVTIGRGSNNTPRTASLAQLRAPAHRILGIIALLGSQDEATAQTALSSALSTIGLPPGPLPPANERTLDAIAGDLKQLERAKPSAAASLLEAAIVSVSHDSTTSDNEYLLLRSLSERLGVPLPPTLVQ